MAESDPWEPKRLEESIARLERVAGQSSAEAAPLVAGPGTPRAGVTEAPLLRLGALLAAVVAALIAALVTLRRAPAVMILATVALAFLAARLWSRARAAASPPPPEPPAKPIELELSRTQAALTGFVDAIERAPEPVRAFVKDAERAARAIGHGSRALAARGVWLHELLLRLDSKRLEAEHLALVEKRDRAQDPSARHLLTEALRASEQKRQSARALAAESERLLAEQLRIRHAVEALQLDLERTLAADPIRGQAEATRSLASLSNEISAIAAALEEARQLG